MVNPTNPISSFYVEQCNAAGPKLGLTCKPYDVGTLDGLEGAFDAMVATACRPSSSTRKACSISARRTSRSLALARKLPCCGYVKEALAAGVLISYGADQRLIARRTAYYVDRILKGEKPRGHAGGTADRFPALHQSHNGEGARDYHSADVARPAPMM